MTRAFGIHSGANFWPFQLQLFRPWGSMFPHFLLWKRTVSDHGMKVDFDFGERVERSMVLRV